MILATYRTPDDRIVIGVVHDRDQVLDLAAAARRAGQDSTIFTDMMALTNSGSRGLDAARGLLEQFPDDTFLNHNLSAVSLLSPVPLPPQIRDFTVFPDHIRNASAGMRRLAARMAGDPERAEDVHPGDEVPPIYREQPVYYKCNRFSVVGNGAKVCWPSYSEFMDFELEFGIFLGKGGCDIPKSSARKHIFGFAIFNDFSARDTQMVEMRGMLGPCKGKDFDNGNVIGPWIVTADEIPDPYGLKMRATVNGECWCEGTSSGMLHSFEEMISYVSRSETLYPGEFFGSGTIGNGCGLELNRYLADADIVKLEVEQIGTLQNQVVKTGSDDRRG
jgi:2-keto-4-pentenoate hydratase/2-oxohepta-3-ene-1,7-dioic acid hydratase in catechol pathway